MNIAIGASPLCYARGGTERMATALAHAMLARGHTIHMLAYDHGRPPAYPLDSHVSLKLVSRNFAYGKHSEIAAMRRYLLDNDVHVFVSMQSEWTHMLWALCCLGAGVPFIMSERSDPRYSEAATWNRPGRQAVLASADAIHELTSGHLETVPDIYRHKTRVIPNPAPATALRSDAGRADGHGTILFLARFIPSKRCDLLLRAFTFLQADFPGWRLRIAGYGQEEKNLRKLADRLGVSGRTDFVIQPPYWEDEYAKAQVYCLPTCVEGSPNTAVEALALGLPIVGIADCPAMRGIVTPQIGLLAAEASPQALAAELRKLMQAPELRAKMGANALRLCQTTYNADQIWTEWESFLGEMAAKKGQTVMDAFRQEPFASMATLAAATRREYLYRNFGETMPYTAEFFMERLGNLGRALGRELAQKKRCSSKGCL